MALVPVSPIPIIEMLMRKNSNLTTDQVNIRQLPSIFADSMVLMSLEVVMLG